MRTKAEPSWQDILAILSNKATRQLFAKAELGLLTMPEANHLTGKELKALNRLRASAVVVPDDEGFHVNSEILRAPLSQSSTQSPQTTISKYVDGTKLHTMPRKPEERISVLRWIMEQAVPADSSLSEPSLNERLSVFHSDVAMLRRYMVDLGLLQRSRDGGLYSRAD